MTDSEEDEIIARAVCAVNDLFAVGSLSAQNLEIINEDRIRNTDYYEVIIPRYSPEEFRCHFRMSRTCFSDLITKVGNLKSVRHLEKKLLFTVWVLSKQESFLSSGDRFNFAPCSAHRAFCEILDLLCSLMAQYIKWPARSQYNEISRVFREKSGGYIPGIIAAIDGCHIQIKQPVQNPIDYYNRKNTHSIILQGTCLISIYIKESRVCYNTYNSRSAGPILMVFDSLDLSPPRIAEYILKTMKTSQTVPMLKNNNLLTPKKI